MSDAVLEWLIPKTPISSRKKMTQTFVPSPELGNVCIFSNLG